MENELKFICGHHVKKPKYISGYFTENNNNLSDIGKHVVVSVQKFDTYFVVLLRANYPADSSSTAKTVRWFKQIVQILNRIYDSPYTGTSVRDSVTFYDLKADYLGHKAELQFNCKHQHVCDINSVDCTYSEKYFNG